jgi:hypothetical protein
MKTKIFSVIIATQLILSSTFAAAIKTYQVTGPILEITDSTIVVLKGKERWEIARNAETKITGELKTGAKVTIEYKMTATSIEVKTEKSSKEDNKM